MVRTRHAPRDGMHHAERDEFGWAAGSATTLRHHFGDERRPRVSLRPSRIHRIRNSWRVAEAIPAGQRCLPRRASATARLGEDEEADGSPHDRPSEAEAAAVADSLLARGGCREP